MLLVGFSVEFSARTSTGRLQAPQGQTERPAVVTARAGCIISYSTVWTGQGGGSLDLPGLTQVIRTFQDQTYVATLIGDDDDCVFSLSETNREGQLAHHQPSWTSK